MALLQLTKWSDFKGVWGLATKHCKLFGHADASHYNTQLGKKHGFHKFWPERRENNQKTKA